MFFENREDAGSKLAQVLKKYRGKNVLVLALPRGGVPVGLQIAKYLRSPLNVFIVRKIGLPSNPELAIGAISERGGWYMDKFAIQNLGVSQKQIDEISRKELLEIIRRQKEYRGSIPPPEIIGKTIILVDDGVATGATIKAALRAIQKQHPAKLILAVPVCPEDVAIDLITQTDEFVCLHTIKYFTAVGAYYRDFAQITDNEIKSLLQ